MQKKNIDSHYLFSRVKMTRKFSQEFGDEVIALSCDDINKLNVVCGMMVSRYDQIRQIYMKDDSPDYEDHDFNLPGYQKYRVDICYLSLSTIFPRNLNNPQIIVILTYILI